MNEKIKIILIALGFAAGYLIKELLGLGKKEKSTNPSDQSEPRPKFDTDRQSTVNEPQARVKEDGFNLASISYLFKEYNVQLNSANSFANLLRAIENSTYANTLKLFVNEATSPEQLYSMLEYGKTKDIKISPVPSTESVAISDTILSKMLSDRKLQTDEQLTPEDKVQILISYSVTKGYKSFQKSMGNSLKEFYDRYLKGQNVDSCYQEIYNNIKDTWEFLTE